MDPDVHAPTAGTLPRAQAGGTHLKNSPNSIWPLSSKSNSCMMPTSFSKLMGLPSWLNTFASSVAPCPEARRCGVELLG